MSRAFGDFDFKANPFLRPENQMVSSCPEVKVKTVRVGEIRVGEIRVGEIRVG